MDECSYYSCNLNLCANLATKLNVLGPLIYKHSTMWMAEVNLN